MKKKLIVLALLLLLLFAVTAQADALQFGIVSGNATVNLRQEATQYSTWLSSYPENTWMTITGQSGNWYYVTGPDGKTGYMSKNYVQVQEPTYSVIGVVSNPKATSFLNLRAAPSYGANVVDYYYNGVPCVLLSQSGGWYHVRVDGVDGYFRQEYITRFNTAYSEDVATIVTPNNTGLNLRSGPSMDYGILGQYKGYNYVMVLQRGNDWWKVSIDGKVGFMKASFLRSGVHKPNEAPPQETLQPGVGYAVVTNPKATQVLNLRAQPNTTSQVLGQYYNGTKLTLLASGIEWCHVQDSKGVTGYMMTDFLTLNDQSAASAMRVDHPQGTFVNLRNKPSMITGSVITRIPHGAAVSVLAPAANGWVKIIYNGYTGYAVDYFLD